MSDTKQYEFYVLPHIGEQCFVFRQRCEPIQLAPNTSNYDPSHFHWQHCLSDTSPEPFESDQPVARTSCKLSKTGFVE